MKTSLTLIAFSSLLCTLVACSGGDSDDGQSTGAQVTKEDLASANGKADSSLAARLCLDLGAPADCDVCEIKGWYADGECDTFCSSPDPDCQPADENPDCAELNSFVYDVCVPEPYYALPPSLYVTCLETSYWGDQRLAAKQCCADDDYLWCGGETDPEDETPSCAELESFVYDVCVPDEPYYPLPANSYVTCLQTSYWGDQSDAAKECCEEKDYLWCEFDEG